VTALPPLEILVETALLAAGRPLSPADLRRLFPEEAAPSDEELAGALAAVARHASERGLVLREVASGYRLEVRADVASFLAPLWNERPPRYSRALLETLALIAYRQPITRAEIEEVRGVSLATSILKTLEEREWIRVVGHRDVPGRPALYATTRQFLDYFGLVRLDELPALEALEREVGLEAEGDGGEGAPSDRPGDETPAGDGLLSSPETRSPADEDPSVRSLADEPSP
jgi:segregation and condensation protein B